MPKKNRLTLDLRDRAERKLSELVVTVRRQTCRHCDENINNHPKGKCLFEPGQFEPAWPPPEYKCAGFDYGCHTMITQGTFCTQCAREYKEDPDAFK